ncbi:unnamed protein product [Linum tenue]|uniref:RAVE complex protein Rav1 C-terminal domain-containing protein n=1 Tax=Linum tenue TaxID=586396 RepID=A0AAV0M2K3_9ROSI|nr:unnamed protein product [Linum tenue]
MGFGIHWQPKLMAETNPSSQAKALLVDPVDHLPLRLLRSDIIPPAPNRSVSTIDWLPDFAGHPWLAYGASSLLVISHFPSPLSPQETRIGPVLRQVFELSGRHSSPVAAVSWSPVTPSVGEVAAAVDNFVILFSNDSASEGSFCWSQSAVLVQSTNVEAIAWTGSADGIIVGGICVTLWRRKNKSWEIAWKFERDLPQNMVSATWSIGGLFAAAACPNELCFDGHNSRSTSVTVCYPTGTSEYAKTELHHPQHVLLIQWRPLADGQLDSDAMYLRRHILLTCCQDGTVRLWTEVDNRNVRKFTKDNCGQHSQCRNFSVAAVIEINQTLNGSLGADVFLLWATQINGICRTPEGANEFYFDGDGNDKVGACEWLIGYGPGTLVTFWAVHCLDDISPLRFPRVTLWKRHELHDLEAGHLARDDFANSKDWLLLRNVVFLRHHLYAPPNVCSLIHFSPCGSFFWSMLYDQPENVTENGSSDNFRVNNHIPSSSSSFSPIGHEGKILQLAIHPHIYEVGLAASLDSNGLLIFWSVSAVLNEDFGLSTLNPTWKFCGKLTTHAVRAKYTSLRWAPCFSGEECLLLLGHADGIDCFLVKLSQTGDQEIKCHCICCIPFSGRRALKDDPVEVFSIPLPSTCEKSFKYKKFLLLGIWMKDFQAISWEVTLHSYDGAEESCECKFDDRNSEMCGWNFQSTFCERQYRLGVNPCSSLLPEQHLHNQITSCSIACPDYLIPIFESRGLNNNSCPEPPYVMATGCLDGSVKLWKSVSCEQSSTFGIPWKLVGDFVAHESPVSTISLAANGSKIATSCGRNQTDNTSIIHVWDVIWLPGTGMFLLEDKIRIVEDVIALNWLALGNGQYILGACVQNQLLVYAQKRSVSHALLDHRKSLDQNSWSCIAVAHTFAAICDFIWGPKVSAVVVHDNYFDVISHWSVLVDSEPQADSCQSLSREKYQVQKDKDSDISNVGELSSEKVSRKDLADNMNLTKGLPERGSSSISGSWRLVDIAEKLRGYLPSHHPEVLLTNIYSGNWKRAYASVQHLVEHIGSTSETKCGTANLGHFVPLIPLSVYFEGHLAKSSTDTGCQWTSDSALPASSSQAFIFNSDYVTQNNMISSSSSKSEFTSLVETLEQSYESAALTNLEKSQIIAIMDLLGEVKQSNSAYHNLDRPGRRFWVALRYQQLQFFRCFGRLPSLEDLGTDGRMISWAFHSDCHETLLTSFLPSDPTWKEMQALGFGFWFSNDRQLRTRMEKLARSQYLRKKDPKDCALLYIALNRLQVLAGLFKISKDEKDKPLVTFLSRNFKEEKNKAAALKNAYVLMGRHQLELAIAFFLLGGDTNSAITVCAKNLADEQLALIICRLVEGSGGPLECYLITKFILPSAVENCNSWISSLLEWKLGNYLQSFLRMVDLTMSFTVDNRSFWSNHVAFKDPSVGLYCSFLVTRNSMKNAIGEQNATILSRWATFLETTAFSRCGLPLEALECLSSSLKFWGMDQGSLSNGGHSQNLEELPAPFAHDPCNWLSSDVALYMASISKLDLSLQYMSKLTREHPSWPQTAPDSVGRPQHDKSAEVFQQKLYDGLSKFEQKFSVSSSVAQMVVVWLCNNGLWFAGCNLLLNYASPNHVQNKTCAIDGSNLQPVVYNLLSKAMEGTSLMLSRYIVCCNFSCFPQRFSSCTRKEGAVEVTPELPSFLRLYLQGITKTLYSLRSAVGHLSGCLPVDFTRSLVILDLFEYFVHFASAWFQRSSKGLLLMAQPLLITCTDGHTPYELDTRNLKSILHHISELLASNLSTNDSALGHEDAKRVPYNQVGEKGQTLSEDEKWILIGGCLWLHMSRLLKHKSQVLSINLDDDCSAFTCCQISSLLSGVSRCGSDRSSISEQTREFSPALAKLLNATLVYISSSHVKLLGVFLQQEAKKTLQVPLIIWLQESYGSEAKIHYQDVSADVLNSKNEAYMLEILWNFCADPRMIHEGFAQENLNFKQFSHLITSKSWTGLHKGISENHEVIGVPDHDTNLSSIAVNDEVAFSAKGLFMNFRTLLSSWQKDAAITKKVSIFQNPREVHRGEGELLEKALCTNVINEGEAALASNRKGILFFNWAEQKRSRDHPHYILSEVDWPPNGWAGAESTPVPTFVSPGVGLGRKKGAHVGLGGATVGLASLTRPRDLTVGAAVIGAPGHPGLAASGLGWEVQEDFELLADPPATVKNISTRAFSSHPSRPLFLVGSSNTHIYLWEFGKEKAAATYGVLPAANVPPPYALASISSLRFDYCGHRFASAALDGTVCTWQLEVGGRSNICPTESSLCFNSHALDVAYVGSSGSVVAAAGYSSNGVNVVIWDTLAPPTTSRASIICHEGGARSISVFDNDFSSGSISPLIITGGKSGDIGLHDFRYIATGRSKRHWQFDSSSSSSSSALSSGEQNQKGMLWYIPKAHMGSITKISIVPHTSLFLTGSKDGDVKLWDAKGAKLVHHWPKLHERHTFVQPSSRGFSGVVRAGVTDIQVLPRGFLSCGGDGSVKLVELTDPILTQHQWEAP